MRRIGILVAAGGGACGVLSIFMVSSCSSTHLPRGMVGRMGKYDYSPSVIQTGNVKQFWWCGLAQNPEKPAQTTDAILYESVNTATNETTGPMTVMAETPGSWDSLLTCNPKVIGGIFKNPLGDGQTYQYALYYVGISAGTNNNIGVAFSHDGKSWHKYPSPVIQATSLEGYGVGQPALYNVDAQSGIAMFYEDYIDYPSIHHVKATSLDGVHFTVQGSISTNGIDPGCRGTWGDLAYDPKTGYWYATFDRALRDPDTTGGVTERGQLGVELYRIPNSSLFTGDVPWEPLITFDTNKTGFESNFIGGIVHDPYGNVTVGAYPTIQLYLSVSDPQPGWNATPKQAGLSADPATWDIAPAAWTPGTSPSALMRYANHSTYVVTNGWVSEEAGFRQALTMGHVYESPQHGATRQLFACRNGSTDYFVSLDSGCEGKRILGRNGFAYEQAGANLVPIYRCFTGKSHFVSRDSRCEGQKNDGLLAYVLP